MPIYSFVCEKCKQPFDVHASIQQRMTGLKPRCPHCDSILVHQTISAGVVIRNDGGAPSSGCCSGGSGCCK